MDDFAFFVLSAGIGSFYFSVLFYLVSRRNEDTPIPKLRRAALSVLDQTDNPEDAAKQIEMICKKLFAPGRHKSTADMLEDLYCVLETEKPRWFRKPKPDNHFDSPKKAALVKIIDVLNKKQPFSSVAGPFEHLLISLKELVDLQSSGKTAGDELLKKFYSEIAKLQESNERLQRRSQNAMRISALGVILTMYFGFFG